MSAYRNPGERPKYDDERSPSDVRRSNVRRDEQEQADLLRACREQADRDIANLLRACGGRPGKRTDYGAIPFNDPWWKRANDFLVNLTLVEIVFACVTVLLISFYVWDATTCAEWGPEQHGFQIIHDANGNATVYPTTYRECVRRKP